MIKFSWRGLILSERQSLLQQSQLEVSNSGHNYDKYTTTKFKHMDPHLGPGQVNAEQIYTLKILFFDGEMMLSGFPCSTFCGSWNKMIHQINNHYRSHIVSVLLNKHTGASVMSFPSSSFCSVH